MYRMERIREISGCGGKPAAAGIPLPIHSNSQEYHTNFEIGNVIENLKEGIGILDRDLEILFANKELSKITGYEMHEMTGWNITDLISDQNRERLRETRKVWDLGKGEKFQASIKIKGGDTADVIISGSPRTDEKGMIAGYLLMIIDMRDIGSVERALRESEEKYRATVEQSAENIYIYDIETKRIVESNGALQQLLGYSADEMKDMKASDFVAHSNKDIRMKIDDVIRKGKAMIGERTYLRKDGSRVDVEVSASLITRGERKMLCVVSRDITERKRYQKSLIAEKNRAEFYLDLLAHDMGNILHGIKNGLDTVDLVKGNTRKEDETLKMVNNLANRSMKLARDIIKLSRLKEEPVKRRPIPLSDILDKAMEMALDGFPEAEPELHIDLPDDLTLDVEDVLVEVFYNIFHNALKAQKGKDTVIGVEVKRTGNGTRIEVWDHGGGLPDSLKKILFERYSNPSRRAHSGLGMTISRLVMERYGGSIGIEDRVESGKVVGSNFIIGIPDRT